MKNALAGHITGGLKAAAAHTGLKMCTNSQTIQHHPSCPWNRNGPGWCVPASSTPVSYAEGARLACSGRLIRMDSMRPAVFSPNVVPRS